jgi:D-alanyl-D-alanine carboxypeptidase (penicillin-binding protein 5/6)
MTAPRAHRFALCGLVTFLLGLLALVNAGCTPAGEAITAVRPTAGPAATKATTPSSAPAVQAASTSADTGPPKVGARSVIVMDFDSGRVLFAKHPGARRPIASLTKIMTAMVVLRNTRPDDIVATSKRAARQIPTKLGLRPGDRMPMHELMYALMLHSSNDVAVALAEHVSGSVAAFDALMTAQGEDIGLTDTWFASPSGLNDDGYSTARDVATMTRWAYQSSEFADLVATRWHKVRLASGKRVRLRNLNDLLFDYPGTLGVKTGYTSASHWSLVGVARRGPVTLMVVLLGDPRHVFTDGEALLDWGFARKSALSGRTS